MIIRVCYGLLYDCLLLYYVVYDWFRGCCTAILRFVLRIQPSELSAALCKIASLVGRYNVIYCV